MYINQILIHYFTTPHNIEEHKINYIRYKIQENKHRVDDILQEQYIYWFVEMSLKTTFILAKVLKSNKHFFH